MDHHFSGMCAATIAMEVRRKLGRVLRLLQEGKPLPPALRDHQLKGKLRKFREVHVEPDWLLVYEKDGKNLRIFCLWLVSHAVLKRRQR